MKHFNEIYRGKTVFVTGHTGFKGSWLSIWLNELGAKVVGYSLDPYTENDNFVLAKLKNKITDIRGDIRDKKKLQEAFHKYNPDIVFHLAAQPLVRYSYEHPVETYETNVMGTINVMECIRENDNCTVGIMITTDKCYENIEKMEGYVETDHLGGYDPYSSSKGACEIAISSWRRSFFNNNDYEKHRTLLASVRAGNVIGGGDFSENRIIPDCVRALENSGVIQIRSPKAIRPWEHVLEPLSGYLLLGQKLLMGQVELASAWNFGPEEEAIITVWELANKMIQEFDSGRLEDTSNPDELHEASLLLLNIDKAKKYLDWYPKWNIDETIKYTVDWYKRYKAENVYNICVEHIREYMEK